jgi:hypothetical protein
MSGGIGCDRRESGQDFPRNAFLDVHTHVIVLHTCNPCRAHATSSVQAWPKATLTTGDVSARSGHSWPAGWTGAVQRWVLHSLMQGKRRAERCMGVSASVCARGKKMCGGNAGEKCNEVSRTLERNMIATWPGSTSRTQRASEWERERECVCVTAAGHAQPPFFTIV